MVQSDVETTKAFIEMCEKKPYNEGILSDVTFAVKDIIDVEGIITGCGNPSWRKSRGRAYVNALCVDQLLSAGARCVGKTHTDEFAFSLLGENYFYGTPLNPNASDRVPGGSSSGSASAVACGLVDVALGTDTGGSVRVPASNCGIWGFRPTHGRISVAGVHPFAPTFDTVGVLASTHEHLSKSAHVLLSCEKRETVRDVSFLVLMDAFDLCDELVKTTLLNDLENVCSFDVIHFSDIFQDYSVDFDLIFQSYCTIQWAEIWNTHSYIIEDLKPVLGPHTKKNFEITKHLNRSTVQHALQIREWFAQMLNGFLGQDKTLVIPTTPTIAPKKQTIGKDRRKGTYYPKTLGLTAISGLARLPQISVPFSTIDSCPMGLSLLMRKDCDASMLSVSNHFNQ